MNIRDRRNQPPRLSSSEDAIYLEHYSRVSQGNLMEHLPVINPSISSMRPRPSQYQDMSFKNPDMRLGLVGSLLFHLFIGFLLIYDASNPRAVLMNEHQNEPGTSLPIASKMPSQPEIIKAVSVNSEEVKQEINRLKQEKAKQQQAELAHQKQLAREALLARQQRAIEEKRIQQLKEESEKIALARKKQLAEQQQHLKQLAEQQEAEKKRLQHMKEAQALLKKQQQEEAIKLAHLKQKQAIEQARAQEEQASKEREARARQAQLDAANQARIAGVVDKYKALIIDAISRQWILPEHVNQRLSSQFRIRLAPDGGVLEVSLIRSSGDPILDRSAQTAIYKASPLPVPSDPATFNLFRDISLTVRPEHLRG